MLDSHVAQEASFASAIAIWCDGLREGGRILEGLEALADAFGARRAALTRISRDKRTARAVIWDADGAEPGERSFADAVLGAYAFSARAGSVWPSAMVASGTGGETLARFHAARGLKEAVIVPIAVGPRAVDCLELHFDEPVETRYASLNMMADVLVRSWARRAPGRFLEELLRTGRSERPWHGEDDLLSAANPAGLSRAEYRICMMLGRGLSGSALARELDIRPTTLRTHLRNIYSKTGTGGQAELVVLLLSGRRRPDGLSARKAKA